MRSSIKSITVTLTFCSFLATISLLCLLRGLYPVDYSAVEKRPMAQFPKDVTWQSLADKTAIEQFEDFTVDQFPLREYFRTLKAHFAMRVLGCKQNNGYAYENGSIAQIKTDFDQTNIDRSLDRLAYICERYLTDQNAAYLAIIPDKNYFFSKDYSYPAPDYAALVDQSRQRLPQLNYIDLFVVLTLDDYYKTDWHWDQSRLGNVVQLIGEHMGFSASLPTSYELHTLSPFYGGYHDQSALYPPPESLTYLTNDIIDACTLYDYATSKESGLYIRELFDSNTSYDFFMAGMQGLQRVDNPLAATNDELIVFRDSFGSSLLPLVAQGYKTVYVVDIRNVLPEALGAVLDFSNKDVLFLFSTTVLDSATFK